MSKTKIIFTCAAILFASVALAWGTIGSLRSVKSNTINPSKVQLGVDTKSLPEHRFHDRTFVFTAD
jgi:hypothetical protein